jgi:hypothetical protein
MKTIYFLRAFSLWLLLVSGFAQAQADQGEGCGEVLVLQTHNGSTTRYAFTAPKPAQTKDAPMTLILLAGGSGYVDLDAQGCAQALIGNSLVRSVPIFASAGFGVVLVDAPSDWQVGDGLAGFRTDPKHAEDIGKLITQIRTRTQGRVWLVGTSRGTISAVNAASRLKGKDAPDGLVLTSALMSGQSNAKRKWVSQTVFDLPLANIQMPLFVVGHVADKCIRSPPSEMPKILERTRSSRHDMLTVTGGPAYAGSVGVEACEGRAPHGFSEQEAEVAAAIAKFIRSD